MQSRIHHGAFERRRLALQQDRPPAVVESLGPSLLGEWRAQQELARYAVEHVVKAIAVGYCDRLARSPAHGCVHQHRYVIGIPVVHVVRRELKMPSELTVIGINRQYRVGEEIVALARPAIVVGAWISRPPVQQVQERIVRSGYPCRCTARLPAIPGPSCMSRLAWPGHCPEPPRTPAGF